MRYNSLIFQRFLFSWAIIIIIIIIISIIIDFLMVKNQTTFRILSSIDFKTAKSHDFVTFFSFSNIWKF